MFTPENTIQEAVDSLKGSGYRRITVTMRETGEAVTVCDAEAWTEISKLIDDADLAR